MSNPYSNTRPEVAASEATTLPQRYYTDPDWFQREMEAIHFDMWLCAGRTSQISESWRLLRSPMWPMPASSSRVTSRETFALFTTSAAIAAHCSAKHEEGKFAGQHSVPVSRLDLQARRHAGQRAAHGKSPGLSRSRLSAERRRNRGLGWAHLHQSLGASDSICAAPGRARPEIPSMAHGRAADGGAARLSAQGELEACHPELFRVPALSHCASAAATSNRIT